MIITFTTRKGGAGKSTLAVHVLGAIMRELPLAKILAIDTDPQGDFSEFISDRKSNGYSVPVLSHQTTNIKRQSNGYDFVLIDLAGRDSKEAVSILRESDLAIVPVRPSSFDLNSLGYWLGRIEAEKTENLKLQTLVIINAASSNALNKELKETKAALVSINDIAHISNVVIRDRTAYRASIAYSKSVHEWTDSKAKAEISILLKNIIELVNI